ncbi:uncharacterized protein AAES06_015689 [Glossophaga mutica]
MSEATENSLESKLRLLKCHFTWNLLGGENSLDNFEDRVRYQTEFQNSEFKATQYNLLAYIKHLRGENEAALECLQKAEESIQREHADQAEIRSVVTWGNYAWVYYHMGRLAEAQVYLDKVKQVCEKYSSPYRMESPEMDSEEGWSRLKCGRKHTEKAKMCFEKCLEKDPENPDFTSGLAISSYRLDNWPAPQDSVCALTQAIHLNPDNQYVKVLLALKLQKMNEEAEAERLVKEAVEKAPCATDVLRGAAMLYRKKNDPDTAIKLLKKALECSPNNAYLYCHIGVCYRAKVHEYQNKGQNVIYGEREELQELIEHAVYHLKRADELNGNLNSVCSYLACLYAQAGQYEEAEYYFQKEFSKELTPADKQMLHLRYGNFQWFQMKCENKTIHHFIEGVKINQDPKATEKMKYKLRSIAITRLSKNKSDPEALHLLEFLEELNGKKRPAYENSEKDLYSGHPVLYQQNLKAAARGCEKLPPGPEGLLPTSPMSSTRYMVSSEVSKNSLEKILPQLKCHFTWDLLKEESVSSDLEYRVCDQIKFLKTEFKATMYNLLAYIKHLRGENEAALECLQKAEESIQQAHADQAEIRSVVTWGNYAWVYYHMGRLAEAQVYADKVKQVCKKYSNPYSIECPELDCEEGWTLLRCGGKQNERAKVYFEKALEKKPNNPEFSAGLAIAVYRLDEKPPKQFCASVLKRAIELSPDNQYVKVLLALKLQKISKEAEGEPLVVEALEKAPCQTDVLHSAAKFYKKKGDLDKAIELFEKALESLPNSSYLCQQIACCYRVKKKQIQNAEDSEADRNREKIEELTKCATEYSNKAIERGLNPIYVYSDLTELETEECFETAFWEAERKQFHQGHSNFEEYQGKSEDTSVLHHLNVLTINTKSTEKEKVKYQPQNGAENQLPKNAPNSWYLQGLIHKMNGDLQQAAECFERELGHLLKNSPSGISSFFLPASELEEGHAEVGQGTDGFPLSELPNPGAETERRERKGEGEAWNCHEGKDGKAGVPQSELAD